MTGGRVPGITPPSRTSRNQRRRRSRRAESIVTAAVVLVAGFYAWSRTGADMAAVTRSSDASTSISPGTSSKAQLAVLSIIGGAGPMILVFGTGDGYRPLAISLPQDLTQVVPGMGETSLDALGQLDGATVRVGVSNTLGVWVAHYGVASVQSIAKAVAGVGGLSVDLGRAFTVNGVSIGPGPAKLTGVQVTAYLSGPKADATARWDTFSSALLSERLPLPPSAFVEADGAASVSRLLDAARGARPTVLPVTNVGGFVQAPDLASIDAMARTLLGAKGPPTPVIVQNGNGVPGVGALVAERLIPVGFRVVLSTNAQSFSVRRTSITALGADMAGAAQRARRTLGVGKVTVSSIPSGVGDVKIIVGKDFK